MNLKKFFNFLKKKELKQNEIQQTKFIFYNKYHLKVPFDFVLDAYQNQFKLYDRFLPFFCQDFDGLVIDIGANIGDTSISIFDKNDKIIICGVEADVDFSKQCIENIELNNLQDRFILVSKLICHKKGNYIVEKSSTNSTASIVSSNNQNNNSINYTELMDSIPLEYLNKIDLLKIDIDGYDWDVLNSFYEYTKSNKNFPKFIFFELQTHQNFEINNNTDFIEQNKNKLNYIKSLEDLRKIDYNNYCIFDNFGTHIKICNSIKEIEEILDYIIRSQIYNKHSTIYYLDILVFKNNELEYVKELMKNYYDESIV